MMRFRCLLVIGCICLPLMAWAVPAPHIAQAQWSPAQQQWLEQHRELRVGVVLQAPTPSTTVGCNACLAPISN